MPANADRPDGMSPYFAAKEIRLRVSCCQSVTQPKQLEKLSNLWYAISRQVAVELR